MYGLTRATLTLVGVAVAGFLIWIATQILRVNNEGPGSSGRFWGGMALIAAAGLTMALSQLLGGWTKWGWPRISASVFLFGFVPALVAGGWVVAAAGQPSWLTDHVRDWSGDIGVRGLVGDLSALSSAIAFGVGLVFGLTFDTSGPRVTREPAVTAPPRERVRRTEPGPEPPPRTGEPSRETRASPPPPR
jgi:hypothetical protein